MPSVTITGPAQDRRVAHDDRRAGGREVAHQDQVVRHPVPVVVPAVGRLVHAEVGGPGGHHDAGLVRRDGEPDAVEVEHVPLEVEPDRERVHQIRVLGDEPAVDVVVDRSDQRVGTGYLLEEGHRQAAVGVHVAEEGRPGVGLGGAGRRVRQTVPVRVLEDRGPLVDDRPLVAELPGGGRAVGRLDPADQVVVLRLAVQVAAVLGLVDDGDQARIQSREPEGAARQRGLQGVEVVRVDRRRDGRDRLDPARHDVRRVRVLVEVAVRVALGAGGGDVALHDHHAVATREARVHRRRHACHEVRVLQEEEHVVGGVEVGHRRAGRRHRGIGEQGRVVQADPALVPPR